MASTPSTPSKGIGYLQHFPKYFLVPYREPKELTDHILVKRLSSSNWEMFLKPNTIFNEMSESLLENVDVLEDKWFNCNVGEKIQKQTRQFHSILVKMNTKENTEPLTEEDVDKLKEIKNLKFEQICQQLYTMGHKMFLMGIYLLTCKHGQ